MSILEKICVCVDDDIATVLIYKCIVERGNFEDQDYSKYFLRAIVSTIFDVVIILLVAFGY